MKNYGSKVSEILPKMNVTARRRAKTKRRRIIIICIILILVPLNFPGIMDFPRLAEEKFEDLANLYYDWAQARSREKQRQNQEQYNNFLARLRDTSDSCFMTWSCEWTPVSRMTSVVVYDTSGQKKVYDIVDNIGGPEVVYTEKVTYFKTYTITRSLSARKYIFAKYDLDSMEVRLTETVSFLSAHNPKFIFQKVGIRPGSPEWSDLEHLFINPKRVKKKIQVNNKAAGVIPRLFSFLSLDILNEIYIML